MTIVIIVDKPVFAVYAPAIALAPFEGLWMAYAAQKPISLDAFD